MKVSSNFLILLLLCDDNSMALSEDQALMVMNFTLQVLMISGDTYGGYHRPLSLSVRDRNFLRVNGKTKTAPK